MSEIVAAPTTGSRLVDILRDFLEVHQQLRQLIQRGRDGELSFAAVRDLVDDSDESLLFRLKERCHTFFRVEDDTAKQGMRREALFDLAVGSLFHEAMKLRENVYQQEVYEPKVRELRSAAGPDARNLFEEFERISAAVSLRLGEALSESEALLAHTVDQLRELLIASDDGGLAIRYLLQHRESADSAFPEGLDSLLARIHGDLASAYEVAARSYLASAYFDEAIEFLVEASSLAPEKSCLLRLRCYAEGMRAFQEGDYSKSLERLATWVDAGPDQAEQSLAALAHSAITRIDRLVKDDHRERILADVATLAERLSPLVSCPVI